MREHSNGKEVGVALDKIMDEFFEDSLEEGDTVKINITGSIGEVIAVLDEPDAYGDELAILVPKSNVCNGRIFTTYAEEEVTKLEKKDVEELDKGDTITSGVHNRKAVVKSDLLYDNINDKSFYVLSYKSDRVAQLEGCKYFYEETENITDLPYKE
jgi:hypothetical protein